jgi:S1-C subfamily serine protease
VRRASIGVAAQTVPISRRVQVMSETPQATGVLLSTVETGGPADQAGILMGDLIVAVDGVTVAGVDDLIRQLDGERIGRTINLDLLRHGKRRTISVTPRERQGS